ncbi:hypothetical protein MHYP_G00024820 [Metynnis hypsauchen]
MSAGRQQQDWREGRRERRVRREREGHSARRCSLQLQLSFSGKTSLSSILDKNSHRKHYSLRPKKIMGSSFCSKAGFLLFLLLQMSLPSCVRGQTTVSSDPTPALTTVINMATDLRIYDTMRYSTNCAADCSTLCTNASQINCSVDCCSSETCLLASIAKQLNYTMMPMTSTTQSTTTTKATTAVTTTAPTNGKKCHKISCSGDTCYQGNTNVVLCSTQNYCMLKKATSGTVVTWTGGCSEDCSKETACSSTTSTCFLECCNATTTASCLKLTGAVNMPSSATRGLFSPVLLMACSLLLWITSMDSSA